MKIKRSKEIVELLNNIKDCFEFSKKIKFKTIDLKNIALHEAQINLKKILKENPLKTQEYFDTCQDVLDEYKREKIIFDYVLNENMSGFIIQPTSDTNINNISYQYELIFFDNEIIA